MDGDDADLAIADSAQMPYDASDIDSAQLRGRYDARLLSENISGYRSEATADEEATSCRNANAKYVHGQKVRRLNLRRLWTNKCMLLVCVVSICLGACACANKYFTNYALSFCTRFRETIRAKFACAWTARFSAGGRNAVSV